MPPVKAPSRTQSSAVPVFALKWQASQDNPPYHVLAYSGGGGSAKTGIGNSIQVCINYDETSISIDTGEDIAVALDMFITKACVFLAVGIKNSVKVFYISLQNQHESHEDVDHDEQTEEVKQIAHFDLSNEPGVNALQWNNEGSALVVGCESGKVHLISAQRHPENITKLTLRPEIELDGHVKAICSVCFHPTNSGVMMSSAKDGTCRIWNMAQEGDKCMKVLECKIFDPKGPEPSSQILNPKIGQCLVRGCAFGDLEGKTLYTIQSGRKGGAFLSVWKFVRRAIPSSDENVPSTFQSDFQEIDRRQVSIYPVSAMSISGDMKTLALGDTNGSITLLNTKTLRKDKFWESAHDLPVTCIAARPSIRPLSGEDLTGVVVDSISASADNKLTFVTKQRKSSLKSAKSGSNTQHMLGLSYIFHVLICIMIWYASRVAFDVCRGEDDVKDCILNKVLWAGPSSNLPGIAFLPQ